LVRFEILTLKKGTFGAKNDLWSWFKIKITLKKIWTDLRSFLRRWSWSDLKSLLKWSFQGLLVCLSYKQNFFKNEKKSLAEAPLRPCFPIATVTIDVKQCDCLKHYLCMATWPGCYDWHFGRIEKMSKFSFFVVSCHAHSIYTLVTHVQSCWTVVDSTKSVSAMTPIKSWKWNKKSMNLKNNIKWY
jgi:hypothetical protein